MPSYWLPALCHFHTHTAGRLGAAPPPDVRLFHVPPLAFPRNAITAHPQILSGHAAAALAASKVGGIVAIVAALATMFRPNWAPATGLVFAVAKGAALAGFSAVMVRQGRVVWVSGAWLRGAGCVGRGITAER